MSDTEPGSALQDWCFRGITLPASGDGGPRLKGGTVSLDDLELFVKRVREEMPGALIVVHEYGVRAVWSANTGHGPRLDWSDWE